MMILNKLRTFNSIPTFSSTECVFKYSSKKVMDSMNYFEPCNNVHNQLEKLRLDAYKNNARGPVTLIVGPTDVGKSTLTYSLLNLAAIQGRNLLFVDLDVGQTSLSIPGTLGKVPIRKPLGNDGRYDEQELIVYFFGYLSPGHDFQLYISMMKRLSETLENQMSSEKNMFASGVIIDTCGWVEGKGYEAIMQASVAFEIDVLLVVGDENLFYRLSYDLSSRVKKICIPKLKGVIKRNRNERRRNRDNKIHEYFYGYENDLKPCIFDIKFSDINIFRMSSQSCIDHVEIGPQLLNQVLGVSHAQHFDDIARLSAYGFISFINIDIENEIVTVFSPQPGPLPNNILLLGDIKYLK